MQRVTGAATPLTLKDGTTLRFTPLTDKDTEEIDEWLRSRIIEMARGTFTASTSAADRAELLAVAMKQATKTTYTTFDGIEMLATIPGITFICWLSVRRDHPEITIADLRKHFTDDESGTHNVALTNDAFNHVNFSAGKTPKKARRARVKKSRNR